MPTFYKKLANNIAVYPIRENTARTQKITICGAEHIGKTPLLHSLLGIKKATDATHQPTIGAELSRKTFGNTELQFWDCSGAQRFQQLFPYYVRKSDQVLLVFDVDNPDSLENLKEYLALIKSHAPNATLILVGIRQAPFIEADISKETIADFTAEHNIPTYFEISPFSLGSTDLLRQHLLQSATPVLTEEEKKLLQIKQYAEDQIALFEALARTEPSDQIREAMLQITNYLKHGLTSENPARYFSGAKELLEGQLHTLQYSVASLYSSALNIIALTFSYCSIVGIAALWISGLLENNKKTKGNPYLFVDKGQKQQAEEIISQTIALFHKSN